MSNSETTLQRVTYDQRADACYVYLVGDVAKGGVARTVQVTDDINLDLDHKGRPIGIEILSASLLRPELMLRAELL